MLYDKKAFTLVELIITIIILGILFTVGFISYSNYLTSSRDANRISQLKAMQGGLNSYRINHSLPQPENGIDISIDSQKIGIQGYIGEKVLETLRHSNDGLDPKYKTYYSYYLTKNRKYFQLMAFLEDKPNSISLISNIVNALDYSDKYPYVVGYNLGMLTDDKNTPVQEVYNTGLDITNSLSGSLKSFFVGNRYVEGTGSLYTEFKKISSIDQVGGKRWTIDMSQNEFVYGTSNGICGPANGTNVYSTPAVPDLCSSGTASDVVRIGDKYLWSCSGNEDGTTIKCAANSAGSVCILGSDKIGACILGF